MPNGLSLILKTNFFLGIYRVIQEERSVFWDTIVTVIVKKKVHMITCPVLNGY